METFWFWAVAGAMTVIVAAFLIRSLAQAREELTPAAVQDMQVYRDQLSEADRDLARGTITAAEAERLKTEVARRLLEADRALRAETAPGTALRAGWLPIAAVLAAGLAALGLYARIGVPWYADLPIADRIAAADAAMAARPAQADFLAREGLTPAPQDIAAAQDAAAAISDPAALEQRIADSFVAQDYVTALAMHERRIALLGDAATARDQALLALILVSQARGYVSPEAEAGLRAALMQDPENELAIYLLGEMLIQGERFDLAFRFWRPLLERGSPDAPWNAEIRQNIEDLAYLAGESYQLPQAAPGPSGADMAAAAEMTPEEQQAMIAGMVAQLQERLASEGGSAEEWARLITALGVLGRKDEAQAIYGEAQGRFAGREDDLAALAAAATTAGLAP